MRTEQKLTYLELVHKLQSLKTIDNWKEFFKEYPAYESNLLAKRKLSVALIHNIDTPLVFKEEDKRILVEVIGFLDSYDLEYNFKGAVSLALGKEDVSNMIRFPVIKVTSTDNSDLAQINLFNYFQEVDKIKENGPLSFIKKITSHSEYVLEDDKTDFEVIIKLQASELKLIFSPRNLN
jgi:hypothetical protein